MIMFIASQMVLIVWAFLVKHSLLKIKTINYTMAIRKVHVNKEYSRVTVPLYLGLIISVFIPESVAQIQPFARPSL